LGATLAATLSPPPSRHNRRNVSVPNRKATTTMVSFVSAAMSALDSWTDILFLFLRLYVLIMMMENRDSYASNEPSFTDSAWKLIEKPHFTLAM
jgi:hypothetical protein